MLVRIIFLATLRTLPWKQINDSDDTRVPTFSEASLGGGRGWPRGPDRDPALSLRLSAQIRCRTGDRTGVKRYALPAPAFWRANGGRRSQSDSWDFCLAQTLISVPLQCLRKQQSDDPHHTCAGYNP